MFVCDRERERRKKERHYVNENEKGNTKKEIGCLCVIESKSE